MPSLDADIDQLFQLPLAEFTTARNELAKRSDAKGAEIKRLEKPNAAAWAVNQLFWRHRPVFDALAAASDDVRRANARGLAGKAVDLVGLGDRHRLALAKALAIVTKLLQEAADSASPQTLSAISRTLDAVPSPSVRGRLSRPLEAVGISLLAGLTGSAGLAALKRAPADVVSIGRDTHNPVTKDAAAAKPDAAARAKRAAEARQRELAQVARDFKTSEAREKSARATLEKARTTVERADKRIEALESDLETARRDAGIAREMVDRHTDIVTQATAERVRLERRLRELN
ncbi:MAG: hypothetical protein ABI634_10780 [Acidobacteriota bacterium]